jgi:diguanylate cyclase (GGDEF)-like protein
VSASDGSQAQRWLCSIWTDQSPQRHKDAQLRNALEQLEQQQRANEKLRLELADQGLRDSATGLYTRPHFDDQLRRELDLSTREHREFALVLIEIDPFSQRVHELGPPAEARIFDAMGRLLRGNTRAMDASCRLDERQFGVLLSGVGLATAHSRMEGLRRQCATQIVVLDAQELGFSVSMGVASFPHTAASQQELLSACEGALAEAKRRGGNHLTLASIRFEGG